MNRTTVSDLRTKLDELTFIEDELAAAHDENRALKQAIRDSDRECRRLSEENEKLRLDRDKLQAFSVNLVTRLEVISENVDGVIKAAGRTAVAEAGRLADRRNGPPRIEAAEPPPQPTRRPREVQQQPVEEERVPIFLRQPQEDVRNSSTTLPPINEFR